MRRLDAGQLAREDDVAPAAATVPVRSASLYQWTRKRLSGSGSSGPTAASRSRTRGGDEVGVGELREARERDPGFAEASRGPGEDV